MDDLRTRVRTTILAQRLLSAGDRVLLGVSGGPDSVALLHVLCSLKDELGVSLSVIHVDHRLRPAAGEDAAFVEELARRWGLAVSVLVRDVRADERTQGRSLEDAARRIRYEAFTEAARRQGAATLALAHTADDQAETVIMRLIRGAGLAGLSAIPMTRALGEITVIRPLLGVWRQEILDYLQTHELPSRQDETNHDTRFLRNRIRGQLLPLLERDYNPQIKALLSQLAEQCRTDATFLQEAAQRHWKRLVKSQEGGFAIRIDGFVRQPPALQRQLIRLTLQQLQGDLNGFEFRHWREIERLFTDRPVGTIVNLPGQVQLERGRDRVMVRLSTPPPLVRS